MKSLVASVMWSMTWWVLLRSAIIVIVGGGVTLYLKKVCKEAMFTRLWLYQFKMQWNGSQHQLICILDIPSKSVVLCMSHNNIMVARRVYNDLLVQRKAMHNVAISIFSYW